MVAPYPTPEPSKPLTHARFKTTIQTTTAPTSTMTLIATLLLRDSHFLTNATEGKPRVVGYTISCDDTDTDASITQCPLPNGMCLDAKRSENKYGVLCGLSCRLGSYGIAPDQCTSCEKGKYSDRTGTRASVCTLCPIGRYNPVEGAAGSESCLPCEKGKYATMGAPQCLQVCRRGQEQLSNTECKDCPAGMTSDESPEPKCVRCDVGKFAPTPGSRSCEKCPAGTAPSMMRDSCDECPRNTYSLDGSPACIPCKASEFSEPGSSRCAPCIPGQVVSASGDSCENCPAGKQREYHQSACQRCAPGSAASIAGTASCTICPAGRRSNATDRQRALTAIPIRFPQEQRIHAHRAKQTKRHPKDQVDATRASPALNLATMDTRAKLARQGGKDRTPK